MLYLIFFLGLCHGVGKLSNLYAGPATREWYPGLRKPSWNPPDKLFGQVWLALYTLMALPASRIHHDPKALALFALQLCFNAAWSYCFFGRRSPGLALVVNLLLGLTVSRCIVCFAHIDPLSATLLLPYQLWMIFAITHNFEIWRLNRRDV